MITVSERRLRWRRYGLPVLAIALLSVPLSLAFGAGPSSAAIRADDPPPVTETVTSTAVVTSVAVVTSTSWVAATVTQTQTLTQNVTNTLNVTASHDVTQRE